MSKIHFIIEAHPEFPSSFIAIQRDNYLNKMDDKWWHYLILS